jgi:hypothetical protein
MFNSAPNKYYLPLEFNLRKKVMQIYDDMIIVSDRPDFSYDPRLETICIYKDLSDQLFFYRVYELCSDSHYSDCPF